jgi:UDP-N-acetylmuramoyl-tripeptide--D-alanyl-D-alanine ligase
MMIFNINPFKSALFQLYILQLDEYDIYRYLKKIYKVRRGKKQIKPLVWTNKAKVIFILAFIMVLLASLLFSSFNLLFLVLFLFIGFELFFIPLSISVMLLYPLDYVFKKLLISKAQNKIKSLKDLKIIAIAGSYGKTTFKEILYTILSEKYNVLKTPDSVNTPVAISRLILSSLDDKYDYFIVEMGEYYKGDIKNLCMITLPDISVITGINEAHFERMKSLETTVDTIFEVVENAKDNALIVLNSDDKLVSKSYMNYVKDKETLLYGLNTKTNGIRASDIKFNTDKPALEFDLYEGKELIDTFTIGLIAKYSIADIIGAVQIAKHLNIPWPFIKRGINNIKPISHRLEPNFDKSKNIIFIDDTFNANLEGVKVAIDVLAEFNDRRKVFVTPGVAEAGGASKRIHLEIAKKLSKTADQVILIRNSSTKYLFDGLKKNNFSDDRIKFYDHQQEVYDDMNSWTKKGDVVLFQNIWPESYV